MAVQSGQKANKMSLESLDVKRLVVRDNKGKVRILVGWDGDSARPGVFLMNNDDKKIAELYITSYDMPSLVMGTGSGDAPFSDMIELSVESLPSLPPSAHLDFRSPRKSGDGSGLVLSLGSMAPGARTMTRVTSNDEATLRGFMSIWDASGKAIVDYQ
jgi:hypothetical protein